MDKAHSSQCLVISEWLRALSVFVRGRRQLKDACISGYFLAFFLVRYVACRARIPAFGGFPGVFRRVSVSATSKRSSHRNVKFTTPASDPRLTGRRCCQRSIVKRRCCLIGERGPYFWSVTCVSVPKLVFLGPRWCRAQLSMAAKLSNPTRMGFSVPGTAISCIGSKITNMTSIRFQGGTSGKG